MKNVLLKFTLIFVLYLFIGCEKEPLTEVENSKISNITEQKINYSTFSNNVGSDRATETFVERNINALKSARMINYFGLLIDTDEIIAITSSGKISYTFAVTEIGNTNDLINLVIDEDDNGELEEKLIMYQNYFVNNSKNTNNILIKKLTVDTNALSRYIDINGDIDCYELTSTCNLSQPGTYNGHYSGHAACTNGSEWYLNFVVVDCPEALVQNNPGTGSDNGNSGGGGASPDAIYRTPCSDSASAGYTAPSNVSPSNNNNTLVGLNGETITRPVLHLKTPLDGIDFNEQEGYIINLHPNFTAILNKFLKDNPDQDDEVKNLLAFLNETAFNDLLNNTDEYKELMCSLNSPDNFINQALEAVADVGEVDFDDRIINELTGKALCIYNKLKSSNTGFQNAIRKFDGEFPVSHISFKINDMLPLGNYGVTNPPNFFNITVEFSNVQLSTISDLGSAVAFAHEIIHAEIFRKMLSAAKKGSLQYGNMTIAEQVNFVNNLSDNFPGIYDYYILRYKPTWNHNQMASHYRETIADIIEEFDGFNKPRQVYEDISWAGLRTLENNVNSVAWDSLGQIEKNRIISNLSTYFSNGISNCN